MLNSEYLQLTMKETSIRFSTVAIACSLISAAPLHAQVIGDKTLPINTIVNNQGTTFNITGGTQVGGNQFHSFQQFSVPTGNTAYFNNGNDVTNIISRVTGSSISNIDGLIKANGQANLFLINPNGIIFGKNAQLQIGGSFTASTANSIKFADGKEFSATNPQSTPLLTVSAPIGLQYGKENNSFIRNDGNLSVNKDLTLSSGNVISNGTLSALQGNLRVESITGDIEIKDAIANTATFSANRNLILNSSQIGTINDLNLLAKDSVIARDTAERPFIASAGEKLTVQGDRLIDLFILNHPDSGLYSGSDMVFRSANTIIGDAHYYANGNFRVEKLDGSIGNLESPTDPIIRSSGNVDLGVYLGRSLHIIAGGKVTIGAAQITNADTTNNSINPNNPQTQSLANVTLSSGKSLIIDGSAKPTLDIRAGVDSTIIGTSGITPVATTTGSRPTCANGNSISCYFNSAFTTRVIPVIPSSSSNPTESGITIGKINIQRPDAVVLLTNNYMPNTSLTGNSDITITGTGPATLPIAGISLVPTGSINSIVNGGSLYIDSRSNIVMQPNTLILTSSTLADANAGNIDLLAKNQINLGQNVQIKADGTNLGGQINLISSGTISTQGLQLFSTSTASNSNGNSGKIHIAATSLNLNTSNTFASQIVTSTSGKANAGDIQLNISGAINLDGSLGNATTEIRSQAFTNTAQGNSGNIIINGENQSKKVDSLSIKNGAQITSSTEGSGKVGEISILANSVSLDGNKSSINSQILAGATGNGNQIKLQTTNLSLTNGAQISTEVLGTNINSQGSNIYIYTNNLSLLNGSQISTSVTGQGKAGSLTIDALGTVLFDSLGKISSLINSGGKGLGGDITVISQLLSLNNESQINAGTSGVGNAGNITIKVRDTANFDRSLVSSSVNTNGKGNAGNVEITAKDVFLVNGTQISSAVAGQGDGGQISITSNTLTIDGIGTLLGINSTSGIFGSVRTGAIGNGGNINIYVSKNLSLSNGARISASTSVNTTGKSGSIFIDPEVVTLTNGAKISVSSLGSGDGGNITVLAGLLSLNSSSITAETANGNGGNITLQVKDLFWLRNASLVSATAGNNGNGGNIDLSANFVLAFATENSDITANAFKGRGGNIAITTQGIFGLEYRPQLTPLSDITASSQFGINGTVTINTPGVDPSKGLGKLPVDVTDSSKLISQRCVADNTGSKFFITGRGGLPPSPSDTIYRTTQILANVGSVSNAQSSAQSNQNVHSSEITSSTQNQDYFQDSPLDRIVEIEGWIVDKSGRVSLVSKSLAPNWIWSNQPKCI